MLGSKRGHSPDVVLGDVGGDDEQSWVRVTQLVAAVQLADGPALIGKTLRGAHISRSVPFIHFMAVVPRLLTAIACTPDTL